jgi:hypothetical protein
MKSTEGTDEGLENIDVIKLLNKQIELGSVCNYYNNFGKSRSFSLEAQHLLDINECGRVLLFEASVALSVWPILLARANTRLEWFFTPCCTDQFAPPVGALWKIEPGGGSKLALVQMPPNNPFPCH